MVTTEVEVGEVVEASIIVAAVVDTAVVEEATSRTEAIKTGEVSNQHNLLIMVFTYPD